MVNVADGERQSYTYETRLLKYAYRGFRVIVPGFEWARISPHLFNRDSSSVHGVARLLLLERVHVCGPEFGPDGIIGLKESASAKGMNGGPFIGHAKRSAASGLPPFACLPLHKCPRSK